MVAKCLLTVWRTYREELLLLQYSLHPLNLWHSETCVEVSYCLVGNTAVQHNEIQFVNLRVSSCRFKQIKLQLIEFLPHTPSSDLDNL